MSDAIRIRAMTAEDVEAVIGMERQTDTAPHWSRDDYLCCLEQNAAMALQRFALVAESGYSLAGFLVLRLLKLQGDSEAELESIVVAPFLQGQGIGRRLMTAGLQLARSQGARRFSLEVRASNQAAIRLYQSFKLAEIGRRPGYFHLSEEDAVLMSINLELELRETFALSEFPQQVD
ncbi:Ribosomal-protein-S18p-alanine acetyltransferase [Acidisarcina polymorpha]|uniref:Ribosomal-protein-S18p-alanine acetyltransferase n=1 Tax=Acidisarcina polymorpha TaxID=2211140 RepID=A0A2Z5G801_9BACT|nr:GNAT family N-acetyltransferase [Acidisarcina polymorpha]AXC14824.1 Ribosomal-protein-S18p-alanine acetyltransferase [Acidisarcina polymorpha]